MDLNELNALLDLKPSHVKAGPATVTDNPHVDAVQASETALELDSWDLFQGKSLLNKLPSLKETKLTELDVADLHAAAFLLQPKLTENCTDKRRSEFVRNLLESPEYKSLHQSTALNAMTSEMATAEFGRSYSALCQQQQEEEKREQDRGPGKKSDKNSEMAKHLQGLAAASQAVKAASKEVKEFEEACEAAGLGQGNDGGKVDPKRMKEVFTRVKNNRLLRRICELAGRYRRVAQSRQRQKAQHGYDDVVDVEQSGDIARLLPSELAKLASPEFELDTMRRVLERQALCRKHEGQDNVGKGPIIVCVDESGSMSGEPVCQAKAFALAMAWIARHQKRWCCLIGYSGGHEGTRCILPPGKWDEVKLLDWLTHFYNGGTTMDVPLKEMPTTYWQEMVTSGLKPGKTDLILLTDAIVHVPQQMKATFNAWREQQKVKVHTLLIGCGNYGGRPGGDLADVSDAVHAMSRIALEEEGVQQCLSI